MLKAHWGYVLGMHPHLITVYPTTRMVAGERLRDGGYIVNLRSLPWERLNIMLFSGDRATYTAVQYGSFHDYPQLNALVNRRLVEIL